MRINWFEYKNITSGISIDRIELNDINLLVGVSGAGKTTILRVLSHFISIICKSQSVVDECCFTMNFSINNLESIDTYEWRISTTKSSMVDRISSGIGAFIVDEEVLYKNNEKILSREKGKPLFIKGFFSVPQIPSDKSTIAVFKDESIFDGIKLSFASAVTTEWQNVAYMTSDVRLYDDIFNLDELKRISYGDMALYMSMLPLVIRLKVADVTMPEKFLEYKEKITDIFPYIKDIKTVFLDKNQEYVISICMDNNIWVTQDKISSGIIKTMNVLSYIFFNFKGSLIIIDEIENSLGVNCLDEVIDSIVECVYDNNAQAILTSHHPYIINNIDSENWKIVSQTSGKISTVSATDVGIGLGDRDKFFELINILRR